MVRDTNALLNWLEALCHAEPRALVWPAAAGHHHVRKLVGFALRLVPKEDHPAALTDDSQHLASRRAHKRHSPSAPADLRRAALPLPAHCRVEGSEMENPEGKARGRRAVVAAGTRVPFQDHGPDARLSTLHRHITTAPRTGRVSMCSVRAVHRVSGGERTAGGRIRVVRCPTASANAGVTLARTPTSTRRSGLPSVRRSD
jgi:hypothetical protein